MTIEIEAEIYAEEVKKRLILDPIERVDPIIVSNAHKAGFLKGAYFIHDKHVPIFLRMHRKVTLWRMMFWCAVFVIFSLTTILIFK